MSTDHGPGAPSFGDLFEDPDSPVAPASPPKPAPEHAADRTADQAIVATAGAEPEVAPHADAEPDTEAPLTVRPLVAEAVVAEAVVVQPVAARPVVRQPVTVQPAVVQPVAVQPAAADARDRADHDLDHESSEASHLVAGFETVDDEPAREPLPSTPGAAAVVAVDDGGAVSVAPVAQPWDGTIDPAISSAPAGRVDTGRLYRSAGAEGPATLDAIPAIDSSYTPGRRIEVASEQSSSTTSAEKGLTYSGVVVVVGAATVLVAFAEAILRHEIGVATGVALLVSSVYAALVVRRVDIWAAVVVPPLAFLAAALTAGQLTLDKSGSLLIREGFSLFRTLATNAPWILGTTAICLVIVLLRRRRP